MIRNDNNVIFQRTGLLTGYLSKPDSAYFERRDMCFDSSKALDAWLQDNAFTANTKPDSPVPYTTRP